MNRAAMERVTAKRIPRPASANRLPIPKLWVSRLRAIRP
jgi:hypothetical protein